METILNQNKMLNLLQSFYTIAKARVGFFNIEGNEILAYPAPLSEYCTLIRTAKKGDDACKKCDHDAFQYSTRHKGLYIYQCHAGLTEMIAPIITAGDERIGYLMIGQIRLLGGPDMPQWEKIWRKGEVPSPDLLRIKDAYGRLTVMRTDQVRAGANILQAFANYVWLDNYIRIQNEPLSIRVEKYIRDNLRKPLGLSKITRQFGVGKTTLCKAVKQDFHRTVTELIRDVRIERAKQLLQSGKQPVCEIAEEVGILDYNYFTKVFKEEIGVPPSTFRKLCEGDHLRSSLT
jgi:AraC-like DNA-binding protein